MGASLVLLEAGCQKLSISFHLLVACGKENGIRKL
jgi:hypothetical protein